MTQRIACSNNSRLTLISLLLTTSTLITQAHAHQHFPFSPVSHLWSRAEPQRNVPDAGFFNPYDNGGSMLTGVTNTYPEGVIKGEPLNVIISGNSDAKVLKDQEVDGGLRNYFLSLGFSGECLGQTDGDGAPHTANLGDGNGQKNQSAVLRYNYGDPALGTCQETIKGGNHFRYYVQNGAARNTGAVFLETSAEMDLKRGHMIFQNGYNMGRDLLVGNITGEPIPVLSYASTTGSTQANTSFTTVNPDNSTTQFSATLFYEGITRAAGYTYHTAVTYTPGIIPNSNIGVNHNESVPITDGRHGEGGTDENTGTAIVNAVDGLVAVLVVRIVGAPEGSGALSMRSGSSFVVAISLGVSILGALGGWTIV